MFCFILLTSLVCFSLSRNNYNWKFQHSATGVTLNVAEKDRKSFEEFFKTALNSKNGFKRKLQIPNDITIDEQQQLLDQHNDQRSTTASGDTPGHPAATMMNELFWDPALAKTAEKYAKKCKWEHNPNRAADTLDNANLATFTIDGTPSVGENLYAVSFGISSVSSLLSGIDAWYDEYEYYTYSSRACSDVCGHYTQVVWDTTRYLGCGYYYCSNGLDGLSWSSGTILVCNYSPAGNFPRQPYTEASQNSAICTECEYDRTNCTGGLCSGCMNPDYVTIDDECSNRYSNCDNFIASCGVGCKYGNESTWIDDSTCKDCPKTCGACSDTSIYQITDKTCDNGLGKEIINPFGTTNNRNNNKSGGSSSSNDSAVAAGVSVTLIILFCVLLGYLGWRYREKIEQKYNEFKENQNKKKSNNTTQSSHGLFAEGNQNTTHSIVNVNNNSKIVYANKATPVKNNSYGPPPIPKQTNEAPKWKTNNNNKPPPKAKSINRPPPVPVSSGNSGKSVGGYKIVSLNDLQNKVNISFCDKSKLECYLSNNEFNSLFGMSFNDFNKLPKWKQNNLKKKNKLF